MNLNRRQFALGLAAAPLALAAQEPKFNVNQVNDGSRAIPISLNGFTGEVASTLRFDLEVAGCAVVSPEQAAVLVQIGRAHV